MGNFVVQSLDSWGSKSNIGPTLDGAPLGRLV